MKEVLLALAAAWIITAWAGCATGPAEPSSTEQHDRVLFGTQSGAQYIEHPGGTVQNLNTGAVGVRRGAWIQDLQTGEMHFTYGNFVEESPKKK